MGAIKFIALNLRNIEKTVSDILFRIRFPFQSSLWISVSGCKLTILPDIQPANRLVIISGSVGAFNWKHNGTWNLLS